MCRNACLSPSRHPVHPSWWAASLTPRCWFQLCFGKDRESPDSFCLLSVPPQLSFHSCCPTAGHTGWAGWPSIWIWCPRLWREERGRGQRACDGTRLWSRGDRCWWLSLILFPPPFLSSSLSPLCLQSIHRTIFEVFEIWASEPKTECRAPGAEGELVSLETRKTNHSVWE